MKSQRLVNAMFAAACAAALVSATGIHIAAQQGSGAPSLGTSATLETFLSATLVFFAADADKDGAVTREELKAAAGKWFTAADEAETGSVTGDQLTAALNTAMPASGLAAAFNMGGRGAQPQTAQPVTVEAMTAALPATAPARPMRARKVLVEAHAAGFVHSSIPLAAKTIEALGTKTGAWSTTISYDPADIASENLKQYDAVFLASTTGAFLDDPGNASATAARRQALLDFCTRRQRSGRDSCGERFVSPEHRAAAARWWSGEHDGVVFRRRHARARHDQAGRSQWRSEAGPRRGRRTRRRLVPDAGQGQGRAAPQSDFALLALMIPHRPAANAPAVPQGPDTEVGTWPDFNRMIGGYFKYHWLDPQQITVKIDDPASPLTAMFKSGSFDVHDEIYTMAMKSWSRDNVRVLTSIDYAKMSPADRALEEHPRADHDFGLSWIRHEGQGRVFYEALGHSERIYAMRPMLEHLLAGMQYVLGDLKADDTPIKR